MKKVRHFVASVSRTQEGKTTEDEWPVYAWTHEMATDMAFSYAIQVLKIKAAGRRLLSRDTKAGRFRSDLTSFFDPELPKAGRVTGQRLSPLGLSTGRVLA